MNAGPNRAKSIFLNAVEIASAAEREAYIAAHCSDDDALREEVVGLLRHCGQAGDFLEAPARGIGAAVLDRPVHERPGTIIGSYKLLQQIGEGGMGTVYMAEQLEPVQRKVALKIIKPGMDSAQVIARFEAERQALALMDHPNIARVLDAGTTESGRPYFVMELVKGVPITRYCDEHQLTPRQRLELVVPICQAVQHAHQKGIIHRDLKPSNLLIAEYDDKPVAKVIDFGVVKATGPKLTDRTMFTEFGQVVGTLEYMSPEQAKLNALDVDTRSDIYALGVLLYELLTGTTPLARHRAEQADLLESLRIIREEETPCPSARLSTIKELPSIAANRGVEPKRLSGLVRGELDWIVMKCLEKDRNQRYETANALSLDIERYLQDEPVQACPPSASYRLRKFMRRNKRALALGLALLLSVGAVAGSLGWVLRDKDARRARADDAVHGALREVTGLQAERRWREALAGIQRIEELLAPMEGSPELVRSVRDLRLDLEMVGKLEEIRSRQGEAKQGVVDFTPSDAAYAQAFRDYGIDCGALEAADAGEQLRARAIAVELAINLDEWAAVQRRLGKHGPKGWKHLLAVARVADPDPWRVRLRDALEFDRPDVLKTLANSKEMPTMPLRTLHRLGKSLADIREWDEAARLLLKVQQAYPNDFWTNSMLAWALDQVNPPRSHAAARYATVAASLRDDNEVMHYNLGWYLERAGQFDDAVVAYRRAIQLRPNYGEAYANLSRALARSKSKDQAVAIYQEAISRHPDVAEPHYYLAVALRNKGDLPGASSSLRKAIGLRPDFVAAHQELMNVLLKQGKGSDVEAAYRDAISAYKEAVHRKPGTLQFYSNLAWLLTNCPEPKLRDGPLALEAATKAVQLAPQSELAWQVLGWAHYRVGDWKASVLALEKSMALQKDPPGGDAFQWFFLAMAHWKLGQTDEARAWYDKAAHWLDQHSPNHEEGRRIQMEAAALLKVDAKLKSK